MGKAAARSSSRARSTEVSWAQRGAAERFAMRAFVRENASDTVVRFRLGLMSGPVLLGLLGCAGVGAMAATASAPSAPAPPDRTSRSAASRECRRSISSRVEGGRGRAWAEACRLLISTQLTSPQSTRRWPASTHAACSAAPSASSPSAAAHRAEWAKGAALVRHVSRVRVRDSGVGARKPGRAPLPLPMVAPLLALHALQATCRGSHA